MDDNTQGLTLEYFLMPMRAEWRRVVVISVVAAAAVSAVSLSMARRYAATTTLATISPVRSTGLAQNIQTAFLSGANAGLQPTPVLMSKLLAARVVLDAVALGPLWPGDSIPGARRISRGLAIDAPDYTLTQAVVNIVDVTLDRETGLVTITATHRDSSVARRVTARLVDEATAAFRTASRAQAQQLRIAQQTRVDSAMRQLQHAEENLAQFIASNRLVASYSQATIERERLERTVALAQTLYTQIMVDREAAIGRELEQTPVVVTLDPVPRQVLPVARHTLLKAVVAGIAGALLSIVWIVARQNSDLSARGNSDTRNSHDPSASS